MDKFTLINNDLDRLARLLVDGNISEADYMSMRSELLDTLISIAGDRCYFNSLN